jgi:hypothetical protein
MADKSPVMPLPSNAGTERSLSRCRRRRVDGDTSDGSNQEGRRMVSAPRTGERGSSEQPVQEDNRSQPRNSGATLRDYSNSERTSHRVSRRRLRRRESRSDRRDHNRDRYRSDMSRALSYSNGRQSPDRATLTGSFRDRRSLMIRRSSSSSSYRSRSPIKSFMDERQRSDHHQAHSNVTISQLVEALQFIKGGTNHDSLPLSSLQNVIPEFDPSRQEQTIDMWLHKVNECAKIYRWNGRQTIHFALPKLCGVAKKWYEGLDTLLFSWDEWQQKLKTAFPSDENYGQLLTTMLAKRARFSENLEHYFHEKVLLLNRCNITGKRAIDCIIFGIEDRGIRLGAEAAQFSSSEKLLCYLRNTNGGSKANSLDRRRNRVYENKYENVTNRNLPASTNRRPIVKCYNCNGEGHYKSDCKKPIIKCDSCLLFGHLADKCPTGGKRLMKDKAKTVLSVFSNKTLDSKYYKNAFINGISKRCFIDFGSHATIIKDSETHNISCEWYMGDNLPVLKGFGGSIVKVLRTGTISLVIDGVEAKVEILVVPDSAMSVPLLVGQSFTEQQHISFKKDSHNLLVLLKQCKLALMCDKDTTIMGITVIKVRSEPIHTGVVYVEGGFRLKVNNEYCLIQGIFFLESGVGKILVKGSSDRQFILKEGTVLARCVPASEDHNIAPQLEVRSVVNSSHNQHILCAKDLDVDPSLNAEDLANLVRLLNQYRSCFSFDLGELGKTNVVEMSIKLKDDTPVVFRPYRLSVHERSQVRNMVEELIQHNIVRPSTSAYSSPIVLVRKKNGEVRMCIDYRALNRKTIKENFPLPRIDDQLDELGGHEYYTTLDLKSGYYQIQIDQNDRHKTAFITPDGHFEFNRMPFGLVNAPAVFMRMVSQVLGQARHHIASAYMDDIIVPSRSISDGMSRLESVLKLLQDAGLTLNLSKCCFFRQNVDYLGFELSKDGIKPGSKKVQAVAHFPTPKDQHTVRQFIGLCSFFRRFIRNFAIIAKPLTSLLKKDCRWIWGEEQEKSFQILKSQLINKPILALYNHLAATEVHTDASKLGVAGILMQRDAHDRLRPVAYFSRQTTVYEQNMTAYELETLAVVTSLQRFRVYLIGREFKVITDCNSLRATFLKRDLIPRVARWWIALQEYNFTVEYKPGTAMCHVDALSRNAVQSSADNGGVQHNIMSVTGADWLTTAQQADSTIQQTIAVLNGPNLREVTDIMQNYIVKDSKLYRKTEFGDRWVVPKGFKWQILKQNHDDIGHFGVDKTFAKIQANYWFPRMRHFVRKYVRSCLECSYTKAVGNAKPPLNPIPKSNTPFDTIHIDHVGPFIRSSKGNTHILVIIEAYTKFICLKPVSSTSSQITINKLREYFSIFGAPKRVISDRGSCFTSTSFKNFSNESGFKHVLNAVATPRANGQVERYNRTLLEALTAKCISEPETKWDSHVLEVQWGLNNTKNRGIGCTPAEALFGLNLSGISENKLKSYIDTTPNNSSIKEIRDKIDSHIRNYQQKQKSYYDKKSKRPKLFKVGDLVSIEREIQSSGQSRKLVPKFQGPYRVTKVLDHDRYIVEDTPITRKGNRKYCATIAVDKMRPWLVFASSHDVSDDENSDCLSLCG